MTIIQRLPYYLQRLLEAFGLEEEVYQLESNLYIEFPDFDLAYDFRDKLNQFDVEIKMIAHPERKTPVIEVFNVLPFSRN